MKNKYILIVYWPMCAGKTTAVKYFLTQQPEVFHIALDKIKRLISDYTADKYSGMLNELAFWLAQSAVEKWFSLVVEWNVWLQNGKRKMYQELAEKYWYAFCEVNIEAPIEILTQRFLQRVATAQEKQSKISVTTVAWMMDRYNGYMAYKKDSIPVINSEDHSAENIANILQNMVAKSS